MGGAAEGSSGAFVLCKVRHNVSLSPCHIGEPRMGVEQEMTSLLMQYSERVQGVVLAFDKLELETPAGFIINEMPYIHCKVRADALVFRPRAGMRLQGTVNKIGSNHIGMLFAGVFNGSVAAAEIPKGFVHNYHQDCWLGEDGSSIGVEDTVEVKVLKVHVAGGMIAIEATMRFKGAKITTASSTKRSKKKTFADEEDEEEQKLEQPVVVSETKKKSKKRKHVEAPVAEQQEADPVVVKKEKKSKHKDKDEKKSKYKDKDEKKKHKKKKSRAE